MRKVRYVCVVALSLFASLAVADKTSDFQEAAGKIGCDSIPYGDLQRACRDQQSEVHPWCDGERGPITCDRGATRTLIANEVREHRALDELDSKRRDIDDKRSHAATDAEKAALTRELETIEREIDAARNRLSEAERARVARKDVVEKTMYTVNKCIDSRTAVMNVFAYALDRIRGENDASIRSYADELKAKYAREKDGHTQAITDKRNAIDTCRDELP